MANSLKPWIRDTVLERWTDRYGEQKPGGRRFQIVNFESEPDDSCYGIGCEVSDKVHFICCALAKKALTRFEKEQGVESADIHRFRNAIIQVQKYSLKVYNPASPKQNYSLAPAIVTKSKKPQFWFYITKFKLLDNSGLTVIDQPIPDGTQNPCQTSAPTIADIPFLVSMEACWEHESIWQALRIQQLGIPAMPFINPQARAHEPPADPRLAIPMSVSSKVPTESRAMTKHSKYVPANSMAPTGAVVHLSPQNMPRVANPNGVSNSGNDAADLYGVLRDPDARLLSSKAAIDQIYGKLCCADGPVEDVSQKIESSELYNHQIRWDQGPAIDIAEQCL
ncbi:hypothetical protein FBU59_000162 [Linderina macrospora]|uniref:Uncharacterized protein n=1 Tax=Linderina macrospora TaxID=4868 RepID=A0ACC1JHD7_9FUNG|nr:hypothetical protein FBU59_000162 [Linderina macrospora]